MHTEPGFDPTFVFICCGLIPALLLFGLWLWALIDCLRRDFKNNDKVVWVLVIVLLHWIGAVVYLLVGRKQGVRRGSPASEDREADV